VRKSGLPSSQGGDEQLLEALEAAPRHVGHQGVAVAEMPIGGGGADARCSCRLGKGETGRALFGDQVERGIDQGPAGCRGG
jgi:hypothetical protein